MNASYTTRQGDSWDRIAYQEMGSCLHTNRLMRANRAYLFFYTFPAGITLSIPETDTMNQSSLPPWKQAAV